MSEGMIAEMTNVSVDFTVICGHFTYDLNVVGQHGVLRGIKWRRIVVLFEYKW